MRLFNCTSCGQLVYFENRQCERCGHRLGYVPHQFEMAALEPAGDGTWLRAGTPSRFCSNAELDACNWLIPDEGNERFCAACRHNRTVPDLSDAANIVAWRRMEVAKHRLIYTLMRLGLPLPNRADQPRTGLAFDFLADGAGPGAPQVMTGHEDGLITLALKEADDAERERRRAQMGEPYRTLLGHFRHEVGHYYWDRLVADEGLKPECRAMFGNDEEDYAAALQRHYRDGPPPHWRESYVSAYAATHAWEDWAETWAHYLHIVDSLETAGAFGLEVNLVHRAPGPHAAAGPDPYQPGDFSRLVDAWLPLTFAMNAMNRSMGLADMYPFILSPRVIEKLLFIHGLVHRPRRHAAAGGMAAA